MKCCGAIGGEKGLALWWKFIIRNHRFSKKTGFLPLSEFLVSNLEIELAEDESDSRLLAVSPLEVSTTAHAFTLS